MSMVVFVGGCRPVQLLGGWVISLGSDGVELLLRRFSISILALCVLIVCEVFENYEDLG